MKLLPMPKNNTQQVIMYELYIWNYLVLKNIDNNQKVKPILSRFRYLIFISLNGISKACFVIFDTWRNC